jgi:hypothetical protein
VTKTTKLSSIAKGLALAVLYPAAFAYVAGKRISKFTREVSNEALTVARNWEGEAEAGIGEAVDQTKFWMSMASKNPAKVVVLARLPVG